MKLFHAATVDLDGRNLVEASAGTGKTHAIATLFVRLIAERQRKVSEILVVTFTEAATLELRDRVRQRLSDALSAFSAFEEGGALPVGADLSAIVARHPDPGGARRRLADAVQNVDEAAIFTIHGFCQRMLHDSAFESAMPFDVELLTDLQPLRDEILQDFWARATLHLSFPVLQKLISKGLTPAGCRDLADKVCRDPFMPVVPELLSPPSLSNEALGAAVLAARPLWDRRRVEVLLGRHKYKTRWLAGWCDAVDRSMETSIEEFAADPLVRFSNARIEEECKASPPRDPFFDAVDRVLVEDEALRSLLNRHVIAHKRMLVDYVRKEFPARKKAAFVLSFDDLLLGLHAALHRVGGEVLARAICARFPAALVDEFQDTDPIQYGLFESIYRGRDASLFLIGDPKQAIYSFRGADVFAYLRALAATKEDRKFTMGTNWRSDPLLVLAVNRLFQQSDRPFLIDQIGYPEVRAREGRTAELVVPESLAGALGRAPLQILFVPPGDDGKVLTKERAGALPMAIAGEIAALLRSGATLREKPITAADVAVLTRTNKQAFEIQQALGRLRVPSVVLGDKSVFDTAEATELRRVLSAIVEPADSLLLRAALTTELLGVTANGLAELERDDAAWDRWINGFRLWHAVWVDRGFVQMFRALLTDSEQPSRLLGLVDGERRMTNLLHLMELLHTAEREKHLGPAGLLHWLALAIDNREDRPDAAQIRLESDERAVKITTIHKSKGLEYPIVYCPYVWDGTLLVPKEEQVLLFHDPEDDGRFKLDLDAAPSHKAQAEAEKLAENLRLLYVSLTRARHRTVAVWGAISSFETSALAYLLSGSDLDGDAGERVAQLKARWKKRPDEPWRALLRLADDPEGTVEVRKLDLDARGIPLSRDQAADRELTARTLARKIDTWHRTASFSQLTVSSGLPPPHRAPPAEGRDRDERGPFLASLENPLPVVPGAALAGPPVRLLAFPRGARAGNFFHDLFEHLDFTETNPFALASLVRAKLGEHGYDAEAHLDPVCRAVNDVLETPLDPSDPTLRLRQLPVPQRLNELEFHFPVAVERHAEEGTLRLTQVTQRGLAEVFRRHPSREVTRDYEGRLGRLRFLPLRGFLKGYVDLVFAHEGRFFIVDYKTNHLGDTLSAYEASLLPRAMGESHYYLQYHLYAVAVHRYLALRVPGYDYDRHFGGVYYLFIKGMTPESGSRTGVFFEKPPRERIEMLSSWLESPDREGPP